LSAGAFHWGELTALPPDLPAAFKRPTSKKRGGEGRGRKRRGDEKREGKREFVICARKKTKSRRLCSTM